MIMVWQVDAAQTTAYYNAALCNALARAGCTVEYWTSPYLKETEPPLTDGARAHYAYKIILNHRLVARARGLRWGVRALSYPFGHAALLRAAVRHTTAHYTAPGGGGQPLIVHMQWGRIPPLDRWLIRRLQAHRIPVIYTAHDVIPLFTPQAVRAYGNLYHLVDGIIVHTQAAYQDLMRLFPTVPAAKVRIIPLISPDDRTLRPEQDRTAARAALHIPDQARVLLFFGTLRGYKGLPRLVEAFARARQIDPLLWLVVAGEAETPADAAPLAALHGDPQVIIAPGYIPSPVMWQYFRAADVAIYPYDRIYQSAALVDAMAFGCPVIVTAVGGLPESVDGNGWVVPPNDPDSLAAAILEAVADPARLAAMGAQSRRLYQRLYDPDAIARQTIAFYEDTWKNKPHAAPAHS
ncbi:MAG: glycosyltransferase family 4 protein [bacterium]|nr:glycosyltransferase family 4 protein [bacterium]